MDTKEANEKIAENLREAERLISEAEKIATEANISFGWSGPVYGMGGYFSPTGDEWTESGWSASSQSC